MAMRDNEFGAIRLRAYGNYAFRVTDAVTFMKEVFGTRGLVTLTDIEGNLANLLVSQMSDTIAESKISALDMAMNYSEFGDMIRDNARGRFAELGLEITAFTVVNISFPETVEKALDERTSLGILSDKMGVYAQKKAADALGEAAKNQGGTGTVIGMGLGSFVNGQMGAMMNNVQQTEQKKSDDEKYCAECGARMKRTAKFCPNCGTRAQQSGKCPGCGAETGSGKFCPECGERLN